MCLFSCSQVPAAGVPSKQRKKMLMEYAYRNADPDACIRGLVVLSAGHPTWTRNGNMTSVSKSHPN